MTPLEIEIDDLERKIESSTRTIGFEKKKFKDCEG